MSKRKRQANILKGLLAAALVLLALELCWLMFALFGSDQPMGDDFPVVEETEQQEQKETVATDSSDVEETYAFPWEEPGARQPEEYTWEEYEALTSDQQEAFQNCLGEGFELWLELVQEQAAIKPWEEPGAKQPEDYSWEEFEALTAAQQMAFQDYLGLEAFEAWMTRAQERLEANPWEEPGAKQPENYTWAEFEALTVAQQMAFQDYLGLAAFEAWMTRVQEQSDVNPWEEPGAKQPENYTWAEFEALTAQQQMAFQDYLGPDAFEDWLNRVNP